MVGDGQDGAGGQRLGGALDEQPVPVGERGLDGGLEAHRVALVVHPVFGVQRSRGARIIADGGVEDDVIGSGWRQFGEHCPQVVDDGVYLRGVRRDVDIDRARHDALRIPCVDQSLDLLPVARDDGGGRPGENAQGHSVRAGRLDRRLSVLGAEQDRGHRAMGDGDQQVGATAYHLHAVGQG